jgi:DHA1 family tetracycline resistance protein-like MFS transporter
MSEKRNAAIGFIFITMLIDVIGFGIIIPIIPDLIKELTGGTLSDASTYGGWLMFAFSTAQFIFSPVLGNLSDRYGRRPILLISLFGFSIDYLLLAVAPNITWLFVGRILAGIMGASFTTAGAYIADISPPEKRAQNFGMIGVAFGLGFIIGPVLGGILCKFGTRVPFYAAAGLTMLNWLYGYFILPESLKKENRREFDVKRSNPVGSLIQLKKYPVVLGLVGCIILIYTAHHAVQSNWTFYTMEKFKWSEDMVGYSLGVVGVLVAIVQGGLIRVINPKLGQKGSVYLGLLLSVIGFVLFAFASESWMMFVFLIPYCLGGIGGPAIQGIISSQVPANAQGELQGSFTSLMSVTSIFGPLMMTSLFAYFTSTDAPFYFPGAAFILGGFLTLLSLLWAMKSLASYTPKKQEVTEPTSETA